MKLNFLVAILGTMIVSCSSSDNLANSSAEVFDTDQETTKLTTNMLTAKALVDNNTYIDVDMEAFDKVVRDNFDIKVPGSSLIAVKQYPEEYAMIRAAQYRYGKSISVVDGYWKSSAEKASDLNMSERTFRYMHDNTERVNEQIKMYREAGKDVSLPEYSKSYLEALLQETPVTKK